MFFNVSLCFSSHTLSIVIMAKGFKSDTLPLNLGQLLELYHLLLKIIPRILRAYMRIILVRAN